MRYIRELIADESLSTQFVLIGLLAVALGALLTRRWPSFITKRRGSYQNIRAVGVRRNAELWRAFSYSLALH
jgi:hypothetical protein